MASSKKYTVKYRRKREGKTDYKMRKGLISSGELRVVVRRMLNNIVVQFVKYEPKGDRVVYACSSKELAKTYGWQGHGGNLCAAYLVGYLCGLKSNVKKAVLDVGLVSSVRGSAYYAAVKGLHDAGVNVPCSDKVLPSNDRVLGKHIALYATKLGAEGCKKQFGKLLGKGLKPEEISKHVEEVKKKIGVKWSGK